MNAWEQDWIAYARRRAAEVLQRTVLWQDDGTATISATLLARVGIGDPIDPDIGVSALAAVAAGKGRIEVLETSKTRVA